MKRTTKTIIICHSGGAIGADTVFETIGESYGIITLAYSYKTLEHQSKNKIEINEESFLVGVAKVHLANKTLQRKINYIYINLLARNWQQIKNSDQVFAVSKIIFKNIECVSGGTGWAIQMAIDHQKEIFVFDQIQDAWFEWSYSDSKFCILESCPKITSLNFAGIGIRKITINGINAIEDLYINSFNKV
ncbi:hypothetical protein [Flavobacterium sp. GP15]|uniref:hypothetical protein n=1 Tax=Flavobacterium sp. GP15 TaxID=2758567 RepID=UPI00165DF522|nr:hypothetical protein [Flavobacterium sp. GP15]